MAFLGRDFCFSQRAFNFSSPLRAIFLPSDYVKLEKGCSFQEENPGGSNLNL
jgi:hypothetical protein